MRRLTLPSIIIALLASTCASPYQDDVHINLSTDTQPATRLFITEALDGQAASRGLLHALIIPADLSTLYHEHPQELETGKFALDVPTLSTGEYDIWIEITVSSGHNDAILKRFTIDLQGETTSLLDTAAAQVTFEATKLELSSAEALSHLEFRILLDGVPVDRFGEFLGVQVHEFAVSRDREWFVHDHAEPIGEGKVDAYFQFPKAGDYVIFLQPTILEEAGAEIRPMLRYLVTVP